MKLVLLILFAGCGSDFQHPGEGTPLQPIPDLQVVVDDGGTATFSIERRRACCAFDKNGRVLCDPAMNGWCGDCRVAYASPVHCCGVGCP